MKVTFWNCRRMAHAVEIVPDSAFCPNSTLPGVPIDSLSDIDSNTSLDLPLECKFLRGRGLACNPFVSLPSVGTVQGSEYDSALNEVMGLPQFSITLTF